MTTIPHRKKATNEKQPTNMNHQEEFDDQQYELYTYLDSLSSKDKVILVEYLLEHLDQEDLDNVKGTIKEI